MESLVWSEVCNLLREPDRLRSELARRRDARSATIDQLGVLEETVSDLHHRLDRPIDGYESGLLQRDEFEQRIGPFRERHTCEASALESLRGNTNGGFDVESIGIAFPAFAGTIAGQLDTADWSLKRDLVKLLIE